MQFVHFCHVTQTHLPLGDEINSLDGIVAASQKNVFTFLHSTVFTEWPMLFNHSVHFLLLQKLASHCGGPIQSHVTSVVKEMAL
jgi:hypothetical protein